MLPGKYEPGPVIEAKLRIFVNGEERPHVSASWQGNTSGGLPESLVAAGDGVYSRTGSITWAPGSAVTLHPLAPVGETRWTPTHGDKVYIEAEVAGVKFPRFTGYLEASTYDLTKDTVTTKITDGLGAALQTIMSIEPRYEPRAYLRSSWVAYRAIEQAGLGVLPPVTSDTVLQNSHQGGALPAVGTLETTGGGYGTPLGLEALYQQSTLADASIDRAGRDVMVYTRAGAAGHDAFIEVKFTGGVNIKMTYTAATGIISGWNSITGTIPGFKTEDGPYPLLAFKLSAGGLRIWKTPEESYLVPDMKLPGSAQVVSVTAGRVIGVKVDYLTDWQDGGRRVALMGRPLPKLQLSALEQVRIPSIRGFENVTAEKIVSEWATATLVSIWVDEEGRVNLAARDRLATGKPSITDVVGEKVFAGSWTTARDGIRSGAIVTGLSPSTVGNSIAAGIKVYQPENIIEVPPNEDVEIFYTYPDEVDVIGLDTNFRPVVESKKNIYDWDAFNTSAGSWWSLVFENTVEPEGYRWTGDASNHEDLSASLEKLGQRAIKMTFRVQKQTTGGPEKYYLATPTLGVGNLRFGNRGIPVPFVRAHFVTRWEKYQKIAENGAGGEKFLLEASWWLHPNDAQRVGEALAAELGKESITFDGLSMLWDPRKQIGDSHILKAKDEGGDRWEVEYLLTGYKEAWEGNVPSCSYDLDAKRVTDLRAGKTYADMAAAYATYAAVPASKTYGEIYAALPERSQ